MDFINKIICGDCIEVMEGMPDESIDLTITSPPYNVGKNYGLGYDDKQGLKVYFTFLKKTMTELLRVTKTGGRLCLNIPFIGNSYFYKKSTYLQFYPLPYIELLNDINWTFRDFVIWIKTREPENPNNFCGNSTQWGSWLSPSCPYLRCFAECILIFHKGDKKIQHKGKTDLTKEEFLKYTKNIWYFPAETSRKHPAPFPVELPKRCIKLYSYIEDIIFDPFLGSGTTAVVCKELERKYIGIDISPEYCKTARRRVNSMSELLF